MPGTAGRLPLRLRFHRRGLRACSPPLPQHVPAAAQEHQQADEQHRADTAGTAVLARGGPCDTFEGPAVDNGFGGPLLGAVGRPGCGRGTRCGLRTRRGAGPRRGRRRTRPRAATRTRTPSPSRSRPRRPRLRPRTRRRAARRLVGREHRVEPRQRRWVHRRQAHRLHRLDDAEPELVGVRIAGHRVDRSRLLRHHLPRRPVPVPGPQQRGQRGDVSRAVDVSFPYAAMVTAGPYDDVLSGAPEASAAATFTIPCGRGGIGPAVSPAAAINSARLRSTPDPPTCRRRSRSPRPPIRPAPSPRAPARAPRTPPPRPGPARRPRR